MELEINLGLPWIASVRYIDYGNLEERVMRKDIYRCESEFQLLPPQAVLCRLHSVGEMTGPLSKQELEMFVELMKKCSPFQLVVNKRLHEPGIVFQPHTIFSEPEVEIFLYTKKKVNLLTKIIENEYLARYITQNDMRLNHPVQLVPMPIHLDLQ